MNRKHARHVSEPEQQSHQSKKVSLRLGISPAEWAVASLIGLSSGIIAAAVKIRDVFSEEVKFWPGIADRGAEKGILSKHEEALNRCNEEFLGGTKGGWKEHQKAISVLKDQYAIDRDAFLFEKYKILSQGKKLFSLESLKGLTYGTYQRLGFAGQSSEGRIIFNAVIGVTLGTAATLSFFNGVASRHKIDKIEDAVTQPKSQAEPASPAPEATPRTHVTGSSVEHTKLEAANDAALGARSA